MTRRLLVASATALVAGDGQPTRGEIDMDTEEPKKVLILHIEVPGFYADDLPQCAAVMSEPDDPTPEDYLYVVTEEWMRQEVGLTLVSLPGEKSTNDDFEVHAYTGRVVGAEVRDR